MRKFITEGDHIEACSLPARYGQGKKKTRDKLPGWCPAYSCSNERTVSKRSRGITFHNMQNDYQQAQASWMQHIVTSLFTNSALFNTRDGRAGKVHNFILGLNLNMSISFSPFRDVLNQNGPVEEVDAVTGKLQTAAETKDDHSILVHIKDEDCVALEVQYHKSCYQQYTRFLNEPARQEKDKSLPGC
ncbi:cytosolic phospholipase A2-like isoform X2 [Neoarius graeffei]|uniref:cytosolic phospholipase A2-like isoform X2 n=1 Tax=Neoarius graeffei TaxID=443677 RepID=UPI00298BF336|nr:cytosolic phospholipase A2-like isoform X2 [Neoarius graeffei]